MKSSLFLSITLCLFLLSCQNAERPVVKAKAAPADQTEAPKAAAAKKQTIVFFGNSLSAGYGLDPSQGFVGLIGKRIDSLGLDYEVVNAGLSGETTAGGDSRVEWILDRQKVDVFILELGGNDMLRGVDFQETRKNLASILTKVKKKYPEAQLVLAGMLASPNMGQEYTDGFKAIYPELADQFDAALIPFLLEDVGGVSSLNLPDGIHPNVAGHQIVRENVWEVLEPLL